MSFLQAAKSPRACCRSAAEMAVMPGTTRTYSVPETLTWGVTRPAVPVSITPSLRLLSRADGGNG